VDQEKNLMNIAKRAGVDNAMMDYFGIIASRPRELIHSLDDRGLSPGFDRV
jgi:hypothetical protein